jgi:hypothetical protein
MLMYLNNFNSNSFMPQYAQPGPEKWRKTNQTLKSMGLLSCNDTAEEHDASLFMLNRKPSKKSTEAGSKLSFCWFLAWLTLRP